MSRRSTPRQRRVPKDDSEDESQWEDIEAHSADSELKQDVVEESRSTARKKPSSSRVVSPRKRRFKTEFIAAPTPPSPAPRKQPPSPNVKLEFPTEKMYEGSFFALGYIFDVLKRAIQLLRTPLSFLVFLWLLAVILNRISYTLRSAFAPLCFLPVVSNFAVCLPIPDGVGSTPRWADFPALVDVQSSTLEQLLGDSSYSGLALQIKKAEMATTDLVTLVRVSDLKSRDLLGDSLRQFVEDARTTGRGLNKLNSKVGGAVDGIMAVNDYALHTIEEARSEPPPSLLRQLIPWPSARLPADLVLSTFEDSMNYLASTMKGLIVEFEFNLQNLNELEEQLSVLHELVTREGNSISSAKEELLSDLWSKVGGNKRKLRGYENHLDLLKGLTGYRKQALVHVVSALQTLTQMSEDVENLRERVAAPELAGSRIPVEVHMRSIQAGLERLKEGRTKAKLRESEAVKKILGSDAV
ncbi:hypothetical protein FB45DRAFT_886957 [Roridomyces roridus]|uniref:Uncharacterized protein n=1 Tax=Roridomyces roridus TaxID=1738132 RepID=A0AAD7CIX3_9AGAR|nr:hypothetical protein FB45DRAFT_886957 [Roridomyces roridus]